MSSALLIGAEGLVALLESGLDRMLLIDSRPFVEYNTCHILEAVNVNCSKLMKRRLQQDKIQITELLQHSAKRKLEIQGHVVVVVYDQSSHDPACLSSEAFLSILLAKLEKSFPSVHLLSGGFVEFSHLFPGLCEGKSTLIPSCISQPCLPVTNIGPTRILPHLYLGCQRDVLNKELMQQNDITYVLNASNTCPKPDFISETHFLRVPVNDSFCEKILPWLDRSVDFIEKAKASNGKVLVHCLAGISRSATIAIAYIMKRMDMTLDEAYRFVKEKRPTISPNFNFLGQLLDFEKKLKCVSEAKSLQEDVNPEGSGPSEPVTSIADHHLLTRRLCCLRLEDELEDTVKPKRSFSLDIKSHGESGQLRTHPVSGDSPEHHKPPSYKDSSSKPCQCSPVQEVSEQSPDKGRAEEPSAGKRALADKPSSPQTVSNKLSAVASCPQPLHRSGSVEETPSGFMFGLTRSQQPLCKAGVAALKGWHSDILLAPLAGGWYFSSESGRFYSTSAIFGGTAATPGGLAPAYGRAQDPKAVRRRGRQRGGDCGDSRRSWHEESSFEKQLKRRSCQMEFEDRMTENGSREEVAKMSSQSSFSGSMEIIEVS